MNRMGCDPANLKQQGGVRNFIQGLTAGKDLLFKTLEIQRSMQLSEKEIEDLIFEDVRLFNGNTLHAKGLNLPFRLLRHHAKIPFTNKIHWYRQFDISPYGIIDIIGFYRYRGRINVDLLELKAVPIEARDFDQIFRYKKGIEVFTRQTFKDVDIIVNPILIGNGFNSGCYIQNNSEILVSEFQYGIDGFTFYTHGAYSNNWAAVNDDHCTWRNVIKKSANLKITATNGKAVY